MTTGNHLKHCVYHGSIKRGVMKGFAFCESFNWFNNAYYTCFEYIVCCYLSRAHDLVTRAHNLVYVVRTR